MPRKLPDDAVHRLLVRLEAREPVPAISKALHVAKTTVYVKVLLLLNFL